jgi:hypothetical protein
VLTFGLSLLQALSYLAFSDIDRRRDGAQMSTTGERWIWSAPLGRFLHCLSRSKGIQPPSKGCTWVDSLGVVLGDGEGSGLIRTATLFMPYPGTISVQLGRDEPAANPVTEHTGSLVSGDSNNSSPNELQKQHVIHEIFSNTSNFPVAQTLLDLDLNWHTVDQGNRFLNMRN